MTKSDFASKKPDVRSTTVISLDGTWTLATDPKNVGREERWWESWPTMAAPSTAAQNNAAAGLSGNAASDRSGNAAAGSSNPSDAADDRSRIAASDTPGPADGPIEIKSAKVPWIVQDSFPGYRGVAWYRRSFDAPQNPHEHGRYLLRFWAVDYLADVWLNGTHVGTHEGAEGVFVLDATGVIRPTESNELTVRVLIPTTEAIDGIVLGETCHYLKGDPFHPGASWNSGGIVDSVELVLTPMVRIEDMHLKPVWQTGVIEIHVSAGNAGEEPTTAVFSFSVAPANGGETIDIASMETDLEPGRTTVLGTLKVNDHRLWDIDCPHLYHVTTTVRVRGSNSVDETSANCGFRDFRFTDGYFRLNGRRLFLKSSHTATIYPVGLHWPHDPEMARREMIQMKMMGFNTIRFFMSLAARHQLDLCDEIGLMVYAESHAGYFEDSPYLNERFDREICDMITRDRNHACVVIWGLLNETGHEDPLFKHAADRLPFIRSLDDTRLVMLDSGRLGGDIGMPEGEGGTFSNPRTTRWERTVSDQHIYPKVPHTAEAIKTLRTVGSAKEPVFVSEGGIGSSLDLVRMTRHYEQLGATHAEDAKWYREKLDQFMKDWNRWNLDDTFASPEDYFAACVARMAAQRTVSLNGTRANPHCVGYSMTGTTDCGDAGEGVVTLFRNLKPGTADALYYGWYPLRWCLFAEPVQLYRGGSIHLEAVLVDEDVLKPGTYPVRIQVVGPNMVRMYEKTMQIDVPGRDGESEKPFAKLMFEENLVVDCPPGRYRFLVTFSRGGAASGGEAEFFVADPAEMPPVDAEINLWGEDDGLADWLRMHHIEARKIGDKKNTAGDRSKGEVILVGNRVAAERSKWQELFDKVARGSVAIFLSPAVFLEDVELSGWLPLQQPGRVAPLPSWLYHKDEWSKKHPIFDGLPCGGLLDYSFYREIIPEHAWIEQDVPAEVVAGAINTSIDYSAGLLTAVHKLAAGKFILNTLLIRENLDPNPVAERLLRNMILYAADQADKPLTPLPADFSVRLRAVGGDPDTFPGP